MVYEYLEKHLKKKHGFPINMSLANQWKHRKLFNPCIYVAYISDVQLTYG